MEEEAKFGWLIDRSRSEAKLLSKRAVKVLRCTFVRPHLQFEDFHSEPAHEAVQRALWDEEQL